MLRARAAAGVLVGVVVVTLAACGGGSPGHAAVPSSRVPTSGTATASPSTAAVPGVTATSVTIRSHQPLTGVTSGGYDEIAPAAQEYFAYVNAHGGVHGRMIDYDYADDGGNPIRARDIITKALSGKDTFAVFNGFGTTAHQAVVSALVRGQVPDVFVGSGCACWNEPAARPQTFGWQPDTVIEGKILGSYITAHFPAQAVGVLYENDAYGQAGLAGLRTVLAPGQLVDAEGYSTTNGSLAGQVATLKARGAQVVVAFSIPVFTAELALTARDLSYHPQLVLASPGADPSAVGAQVARQTQAATVPSGSEVLNGAITDSFLPTSENIANPWIALFRSIHTAAGATVAGEPVPFDSNTVYGMAVAYTFMQALQAAGPDPTRAGLIAAIERSTFSPTGPGLAPLTYSATQHGGFTAARIGTISGGSITLRGPVLTATSTVTSPAEVGAPSASVTPAAPAVTTVTAVTVPPAAVPNQGLPTG